VLIISLCPYLNAGTGATNGCPVVGSSISGGFQPFVGPYGKRETELALRGKLSKIRLRFFVMQGH
jgi:hypothetical protein